MRKIITAAVAALTLGGAMVATTAPAEARPYGYYHGGGYRGGGGYYHGGRYYGHGIGPGVAVAAGVAGLALGAAIAAPRYGGGYYGAGYGYPGYAYPAYGYGYRTCVGQHWVWDPYYGRNVLVQDSYAC